MSKIVITDPLQPAALGVLVQLAVGADSEDELAAG